MKSIIRKDTRHFLKNEQAFRLGVLLTESSHPKTTTLSQTISESMEDGIRMLLSVDEEIAKAAEKVFESEEFERLIAGMTRALSDGKRVFFTGCGATGRLSILLEAAWREFWQRFRREHPEHLANLPDLEDRVFSVMAAGDSALIKSVEGFEDYPSFGKHQLKEAGVSEGDVVIAITEGGETPFVIGTVWQGLESGAEVFFVFNNPTTVLCQHVERSRQVIENESVTSLDLTTGPMAVAGSTRMQATSSELLVLGSAMELALKRLLQRDLSSSALAELQCEPGHTVDYAARFAQLVAQLREQTALDAMGQFALFEQNIYQCNGLVTYAATDYLLDILTDTTERAPTFRLPPFRKSSDATSARSWAFVKNPLQATQDAWQDLLRRTPRGLNWTDATYRSLEAPPEIRSAPPLLDNEHIYGFQIGNDFDRSRFEAEESAWMIIAVGEEARAFSAKDHPMRQAFDQRAADFRRTAALCVGPEKIDFHSGSVFHVPLDLPASPIKLWHHLAIKLVLNTVSTATMASMGRVLGNWMVHVETSNKKLIDRGTRLIAELAGLSYDEACLRLHETKQEVEPRQRLTKDAPSPVALALERLGLMADGDRLGSQGRMNSASMELDPTE